MSSVIVSIDQGTSSTRCLLFNIDGAIVGSHQLEHKQYCPKSGYVEHDAMELWENTSNCIKKCLISANLTSKDVKGIGITNQRETTIVWNKITGKPYHKAIVWNDSRTSYICDRYANESKLGVDRWKEKTGLPLASYFSFSKLVYYLENIPEFKEDVLKGEALFGTVDTWLIWKLTGGKVHVTDVTNASRTLMMNLNTLQWDDEILNILQINKEMLPKICSSSEIYGYVSNSSELGGIDELFSIPISGILGDQQAALFGQTCFNIGETKCTYGTGAFILMNTGTIPSISNHGLLTTVAYQLGKDSQPVYALEGSIAYSGSLIQWLRDNLNFFESAKESENMALQVNDNGGCYFVPAFSGLFAPYWRSDATGILIGLSAYNNKNHIIRAALESSAFQINDVLDAMELDSNIHIVSLNVDGGATKNNLMMQFQSDIGNVSLKCPKIPEMTALGAAFASGLAVGFWNSLDELKDTWKMKSKWDPTMSEEKILLLKYNWSKAITRSLYWKDDAILEDPFLKYYPNKGKTDKNEKVNFCKYSNCCYVIPLTIAAVLVGFSLGILSKRFNK